MKSVGVGLIALFSVVALAQEKPLSEMQVLKAQVLVLKGQLLQVQTAEAQCRASLADTTARLDSLALTAAAQALQPERAALEAEIREALGAKAGDTVDWSTVPPTLKLAAEGDKR
jgi:hypothetical protein